MVYYSEQINLQGTDPTRWRLRVDDLGAQRWYYLSEEESVKEPQTDYVKYLLNVESFQRHQLYKSEEQRSKRTPFQAAIDGANFFKLLQDPSGVFPTQYKGPMFMSIGYIAVSYFTKSVIPEATRLELIRYIVNCAHPVDGGWGLHNSDKSTCFGTTLNYISLRLLGLPSDHPSCVKARNTLLRLGGAVRNPHWGKAWLSLLNLYKWEGVNPAPPELWLMPYDYNPLHPGKWWVHTRAIYLPLSYLSTNKIQCALDPLLIDIRSEIYNKDYDKIDFSKQRNNVCGVDLYYPHSKVLDVMNSYIVFYEKFLRPKALLSCSNKRVYDLIKKEIKNTGDLCIAPVSFSFNAIVLYLEEGKNSRAFQNFYNGFIDILSLGPLGMTVTGTNGSQVWDSSFFVQYLLQAGFGDYPEFHEIILKSYKFLIRSQFTEDCVQGSFRDPRKGAWPFSTKTQGYTVSDCTAEALKAIIMVRNHPNFQQYKSLIKDEELYPAIDVLLSLQNLGDHEYGSFSTYEKIRAPLLLEKLNPAEIFNNIMVEYPYVECTDSSVLGLTYFRRYFDYRKKDIDFAIEQAINYIVNAQLPDGSWYGCWGICFTYAGMFALEALSTINKNYANDETVKKGCDFFISKQREDGGWSETMKSSETHTYIEDNKSLVVQTAWCVIGLLLAGYPDIEPIKRGIKLIMDLQLNSGEWLFDGIEGVFNHSCGIEYPNYKFLFPIKALGLFKNRYGDLPLSSL
ncbi:lanosterol synthase ERG7 [Ascoidea rubescens DSM 1968]|uniref:Terpene cyclase/mutase family member n=1 Tax=Ascoidea rubescens DSM 1968 TaxID=1344418 RepID=A0A1D2V935_9ASCO|nr:terpene synthase [Ascoidea rubescens DSM 1968]ODV58027.1 terpene synthase [Ascoidea rubescens DSM 1968]